MKTYLKVINQSTIPEILLYGVLSNEREENTVNYADFRSAFNELELLHQECIIRMNSAGGSMLEGFPIYDMIRTSTMKVKIIVEGCAASMAGVLLQAGDVREINENAYIMIHKPQGGVNGESDSVIAYGAQMAKLEQQVIKIFVERTGLSKDVVKSWMVPGLLTRR